MKQKKALTQSNYRQIRKKIQDNPNMSNKALAIYFGYSDTIIAYCRKYSWEQIQELREKKRAEWHARQARKAAAPEQVTMEDAVVAAPPEIPANLPYDVCRWIKYLNQDDELAQVIGTLIRRDPEHFVDHVRLLWMTWRPNE